MKLQDLLSQVQIKQIQGDAGIEINDFHFDSRKVEEGDLFIAIKGTQVDGHAFIDKAIAKGASAIVLEQLPDQAAAGITWVVVEKSSRALAFISANFFGNPAQKLSLIGITGTNGKSTSVTLLYQLFTALGIKTGLVSTIENRIANKVIPATHTTPDPKALHQLFAKMLEEGCEYCFMEVSSHALDQERVAGIPFRVGMFTNITHDHLDYHSTFKAYIQAKKMLFDSMGKKSVAIINADDKNGKVMVQNTSAVVKYFALKRAVDYHTRILENALEGLLLQIGKSQVWFRLRGSFNAYNLLMVYACAIELGFDEEEVLREMSMLEGAAGRFEVLRQNKLTAIVDYAHTPDALENVLKTMKDIHKGQGKILTVVGCGGNRDKAKRPKMAKIATDYSAQVILTSDNPRNEDPDQIIEDMYTGVSLPLRRKVLRISKREEAIRLACQLARPEDIILVAGKGHETYQEIKGERHPFDDREVLMEAMNE
ncbi:MAG: UDP-N-acetylmuramoyl-L-alanyl-D-glutamate--2,6-diaminopimelate ligase [Bacteroidota bacterium]